MGVVSSRPACSRYVVHGVCCVLCAVCYVLCTVLWCMLCVVCRDCRQRVPKNEKLPPPHRPEQTRHVDASVSDEKRYDVVSNTYCVQIRDTGSKTPR
jgi:hypothetical protein